MLSDVKLGGVTLLNAKRHITGIKGLGAPEVDVQSFARGGRSGVALSTPFYRGHVFTIEFLIVGSSFEDYVNQRDDFMGMMRLQIDKTAEQKKTLEITLADGSVRKADVIIGVPKGDLSAEEKIHGKFTVPFYTEREYLRGNDKNATVYIFNGGGFAIPWGIPLDVSTTTGAQEQTLTNGGNTDSYPVVRVYGDMTSFDLVNETTGKTLSCSEALATSSDYIDFDFYHRTAVKNGTTNVLNNVSGEWFWLQPGDNVIKLVTASTSADARAEITYQDAHLGI